VLHLFLHLFLHLLFQYLIHPPTPPLLPTPSASYCADRCRQRSDDLCLRGAGGRRVAGCH
jgi:hypothetical protein